MNLLCRARMALLPILTLALSGCLSMGQEPPSALLNLTATAQAAAGTEASGTKGASLVILDLQAPQKLDVTRVAVVTGDSSLAYLKNAQWVDKPADLFKGMLADTVRAKGTRLLLNGSDLEFSAASRLSGTLDAMDYDADDSTVVVRFDAVLSDADGKVRTKRFEAVVDGVRPKPGPVAAALNEAANKVAGEVAEWVG